MADFYETLGVERDASQEQIRKAYLRLSRKLHPDHAGPEAAERYKEVNEAYTVLSNPDSRRQYDLGGRGGGAGAGGFGFDMNDIFSTFFGGAGMRAGGPTPRGERGRDALLGLSIELSDVVFGAQRQISDSFFAVCPTCAGRGCAAGSQPVTCGACQGQGMVQQVTNSLFGQMVTQVPCHTCEGHGTIIADTCRPCHGTGRIRQEKTLTVDIPAGIENGMRIRLRGQGDAGTFGAPAGDIFVEIRVEEHPIFQRVGDELLGEVQVPMTFAALGGNVTIPTLDGDRELEIPAGTSSGVVLTLKGLGVARLRGKGRGDMRITVAVKTPTDLDERQRELLRELAELRGESVQDAQLSEQGKSFFDKLRERLSSL
ncbi:J domain-containing protein [Actinotignum schaalii]|uniref:J domain-containing protein n=1 Tax=Actinotignum schaalii TaxID=59505 RepID=UPI00237E6942|nr:J domain-containing protein [Actinotignum schaalii]MDE1653832.1 J domain-containing protein [Actinotignum schaalii]